LLKAACKSPGRDRTRNVKVTNAILYHRPPAPTEAHGCEQLAQSCYSTMRLTRVKLEIESLDYKSNTLPLHYRATEDIVYPSPSDDRASLGERERRKLNSGIWGGVLAANDFWTCNFVRFHAYFSDGQKLTKKLPTKSLTKFF